MVTVIYLVQIEPKNRFETEKVKDGYRQCGYLPLPPTSPSYRMAAIELYSRGVVHMQKETYIQKETCEQKETTDLQTTRERVQKETAYHLLWCGHHMCV